MAKKKSKKDVNLIDFLLFPLLIGALIYFQNRQEKEEILKIEERTTRAKIKTYDVVFKSFYAVILLIALILLIIKL